MANIEITGIDQLMRKLQSMEDVNNVLRPPMQRAVFRLQRDMANYPPARPSSTYIRTGTYGRRWTTAINESNRGLAGKVGNNTVYGPFVGSEQFQAPVHRNRWLTDAQAVERNRARIVADFEQAIQRALDE